MQKLLPQIKAELLYGGHLQSVAALSLVVFYAASLGLKINIVLAFSIYLASYAIYLNDRITTLKEDFSTNYERSQYYTKIKNRAPYLLFFSSVLSLLINYFSGNIYSLAFVCLMIATGMLYPLYFKRITKKILMFKNVYVGLSFSSLVLYVLLLTRMADNEKALIIGLTLFLYVLINIVAYQILLDIKDASGDSLRGLKTIPVLYGQNGAIASSFILQLASAALLVAVVWYWQLSPNLILLNIPFVGLSVLLAIFNRHFRTIYYLCAVMPLFWMILSLIKIW